MVLCTISGHSLDNRDNSLGHWSNLNWSNLNLLDSWCNWSNCNWSNWS